MTGSRTGTGANTTYTFSWTGANLDVIADAAARQIWINTATPTGYKTIAEYEALSVQQKVNILDGYIALSLTDLATIYKRNTDTQAAQVAADTLSKQNYGL